MSGGAGGTEGGEVLKGGERGRCDERRRGGRWARCEVPLAARCRGERRRGQRTLRVESMAAWRDHLWSAARLRREARLVQVRRRIASIADEDEARTALALHDANASKSRREGVLVPRPRAIETHPCSADATAVLCVPTIWSKARWLTRRSGTASTGNTTKRLEGGRLTDFKWNAATLCSGALPWDAGGAASAGGVAGASRMFGACDWAR